MKLKALITLCFAAALQAQQIPVAVIEFRTNSMQVEGLFSNELLEETVRVEQLRLKWKEGKQIGQRYSGMLGKDYSKSDLAMYPNDSQQSIIDLILFTRGLLEGQETELDEISNEEIKHMTSNPDLWIYKYDIQTESQAYDCLYQPFQNKCCQFAAQVFPELSNKVLTENRVFEFKRMTKKLLDETYSAASLPNIFDRDLAKDIISRLQDIRIKRSLEDLTWKLTKSGSSFGAHNLLHQFYLDLDNLFTQVSEGLPFKKLSTSMVHLSNMVDLAVTLRIVSAECLKFKYLQASSSENQTSECANAKIPNVIQLEVHKLDYNMFVKVFVDGEEHPLEPQWHAMTSAFNFIRFLDSLDTSDYYIMCNHGQHPRVNRAQMKSEKLNKYFLWFGAIICLLIIIQRFKERRQEKQVKKPTKQTEGTNQQRKTEKPKRE